MCRRSQCRRRSPRGARISVTDTVTNVGGSASPGSSTTFYLSTNSSLSAEDVLLGSRVVPALAAGAANAGSKDLTIPSTTGTGSYYVIAMADGNDAILETSETQQHLFALDQDRRGSRDLGSHGLERWVKPDAERQRHHDQRRRRCVCGIGHAVLPVVEQFVRCERYAARRRTLCARARPGHQQRRSDDHHDSGEHARRRVLRHRQGRCRRRGQRDLRNEQHAGELDLCRQRPRRLVPRRARQGRRRGHHQRDAIPPRTTATARSAPSITRFYLSANSTLGRRRRAAHGRSSGAGARGRHGGYRADDVDDSCRDRYRDVLRDRESGRRQCRRSRRRRRTTRCRARSRSARTSTYRRSPCRPKVVPACRCRQRHDGQRWRRIGEYDDDAVLSVGELVCWMRVTRCIGSRTLSGLAAGEASTVSTSLPIPAGDGHRHATT